MPETLFVTAPAPAAPDRRDAVCARLHRGACELAGRLGTALGADHEAAGFLRALAATAADPQPAGPQPAGPQPAGPQPAGPQPIDRLAAGLALSPAEVDLVLLAGLADEHEGLA